MKRMLRFLPSLLLVTHIIAPVHAQDQLQNECQIPPSVAANRPDPDGPPTRVTVNIHVFDVITINETSESFTADFGLLVQWHDPRLAASARGGSLVDCVVRLSDIWHPYVDVLNGRQIRHLLDDIVRIDEQGNVRYGQRLYGDLSSPLQLAEFPFDTQTLPINITSLNYGPQDVELVLNDSQIGLFARSSLAGWTLSPGENAKTTLLVKTAETELTIVSMSLVAQRETGYYFWTTFLPLTLIVLMASGVFFIDPSTLGPQISMATGAVFSLIAFLLGLRIMLPRISYLTIADKFIFGCTLLVFLALIEAVATGHLHKLKYEKAARRTDRIARVVYLVLFGILAYSTIWR
ncbi:MAG: hypothetical protein O7G85_17250 [Planctomycetota bacterium]|nr:hypothetical protein [Planctomycetota bacterium]